MKHPRSSTKAATSTRAAPKVRTTTPARARTDRGSRASESADSRDRAIREVAYAFYEARGRRDGHELDDWFQAEVEVDRTLSVDPVESIAASDLQP